MPKKILLADDSITIQKVVELTFSDGDYEVSAVNNGAKAIQKLAEMRPDIILSDIIMPEKNGYEVCEYVKSHPEYRNIPVVLLTGTFEPFDPDRAEKAGCDAVVTKPFESQSLIHKVEELIAQAANAPAAPDAAEPEPEPEPEPAVSPWMEDTSPTPPPNQPSPFTTSGGSFPLPDQPHTHSTDIFDTPPPAEASIEMPFESSQESPFGAPPDAEEFSGETRAFPRMSFEEMQKMAEPPTPEPPTPEPAMPEPAMPEPEPAAAAPESSSPWDEPAASPFGAEAEPPAYGGETRAIPKLTFDEMQPMAPAPEPQAESDSPFGAPPDAEEFSGETRAFPRMSFEEMQKMADPPPAEEPAPPAASDVSPWDESPAEAPAFREEESPAVAGETRAFPKMTFDEMQQQMATPAPEPELEPEPESEPEPTTMAWDEPPAEAAPMAAAIDTGSLTDEQIDRIARRVVELLSDQVVRNIAWEVIPDLAEMVVKERIRQLESEA